MLPWSLDPKRSYTLEGHAVASKGSSCRSIGRRSSSWFTRITDSKLRRSIVDLVEQIAAREAPEKR